MVILAPKVTCFLWIISRLLLFFCQWPNLSESFCFVVFTCRSNLAVGSLVTTFVVVNVYNTVEIWYGTTTDSLLLDTGEKLCSLNTLSHTRFHTFAAKWVRTALFWATTQRVVVIPYRRFGTTYPSRKVSKELLLALRNRPAKCSSQFVS
jgi:hypothetical protein